MSRRVRTHTFNGRRYKIHMPGGPIDGMVDTYGLNERILTCAATAETRSELVTFIHEALHAENWAATEEVVERVSSEIGNFLWRLNYRRVKK